MISSAGCAPRVRWCAAVRRLVTAGVAALAAMAPAAVAGAMGEARLWVVQPPGELAAFSTRDFARIGGVPLPGFAFEDPQRLSVNRRGEILARAGNDSLWTWDGFRWRSRSRPPNSRYVTPTDSTRGSCNREWYLGEGGVSLFLLETSTVNWTGEAGETDSALLAARMERTDFELESQAEVFRTPYRRCEDHAPLLAWTEPCVEARVIASGGRIDDYFVIESLDAWIPRGEDNSAQASLRRTSYTLVGGRWRADSLGYEGDIFADRGAVILWAESDGGCCGWANEGSNNAWIRRGDVTRPYFDEWGRYRNQDVDVSFHVTDPVPSPDRVAIGFTIRADGDLRESAEGHADSLEIQRVGALAAQTPVAEVVTLDPVPATRWRREHAEFIGWLDPDRVLVLERGRLLAVNLPTGRVRVTGIRARGPRDVMLVMP